MRDPGKSSVDSSWDPFMKFMNWLSGIVLAGAILSIYLWAEDGPMSALLFGSVAFVLFFARLARGSDNSKLEREFVKQGEYFTPRLVYADRQLQALSLRVKGDYKRGALEWESFAERYVLAHTELGPPGPVWGRGSLVRTTPRGLQLEVTFGVSPFDQGVRLVLAPRVTITRGVGSSQLPLDRFDANWFADDEVMRARAGMVDKALGKVFTAAALALIGARAPRGPMPPAVSTAREPLTMKASIITCQRDQVEVTGRPLPAAPDETSEYGQGDFEVESLVELMERTLVFVRALESG
jgi:hypothetical protein